jgi:iron complex transport system substrate-binding protein
MKKPIIYATILAIIILSSVVVCYSQNWFQPTKEEPKFQPLQSNALEIYGNANMDSAIDQDDVTYITKIINGDANATAFADANNDGIIDQADKDQINAIIDGTASQLILLDGNGELITVSLPVNRIVIEYIQNAELVRILELEDEVVGCDFCVDKLKSIYFPENAASIVSVGQMYNPDYEAVLSLNPDVLLSFSNAASTIAEKASKLPGVDVVFLGLYYPNVTNPEDSAFMQGILKAGYIFDRVPQATEYANWLLDLTNIISTKAATLTEEQKQTVFLTNYPYAASATIKAYATVDTLGQVCILSGGENIAKSLPTYLSASSANVDAEWLIDQDPDFIFLHTVHYTFSGVTYADPAQGLDVDDPASMATCLESYISQPMFADLTAVQNNHVYIIAGDFRNNAMGGVLGAVYLAKTLYPDLYSDLNPQTIHQDYITQFLRLDYNLDEKGVFLYPALTIDGDTVGYPNGSS